MTTHTDPITNAANSAEAKAAAMTKALRAPSLHPALDEWLLMAPDGRIWKGRAPELLQVLLPHHPLLQMPTHKDFQG